MRSPALELSALAEHRARPVLGQALAVVLDAHDTVKHEEHLAALLALLHQAGAGLGVTPGLGGPRHQLLGEAPLERRLDGGDQCL